MDDLTGKLQTLLSDPESMQNLAELAAMLRAPDGEPDAPEPAAAPAPDVSAGGMPPIDFAKLMAVGRALSSVQNDETSALISALKPYLSAARAKRADQAVRLLKLYSAAGVLRESGMLTDLI